MHGLIITIDKLIESTKEMKKHSTDYCFTIMAHNYHKIISTIESRELLVVRYGSNKFHDR